MSTSTRSRSLPPEAPVKPIVKSPSRRATMIASATLAEFPEVSDAHGDIAADGVRFELARKYLLVSVVVSDGRHRRAVRVEGQCRQRTSLAQVATDEFSRQMLGVRCAATVAEE